MKDDFGDQNYYRKHKHQQNKNNQKTKNGKENNCIDISSDKQVKFHAITIGHNKERETPR